MNGKQAVVVARAGGLSRRRFVLGTAALSGTSLAAACEPSAQPAAQTATPVTVEFWIARLETTPEAKVIGTLNDTFTASQNRIRITNVFGKPGTVPNLTPAYVAGTPPAAAQNSGPQVWGFAGNDIMRPLNEFMKKDKTTAEAMKDFYPEVNPAFTWRGNQLYFCTDVSMEIWMLNLEFFKRAGATVPKAGWTWANMKALAQQLRPVMPPVADGGFPFQVEIPTLWRVLAFAHQNDTDLLDKAQSKIIIDDPAWLETHAYLTDLWGSSLFGDPPPSGLTKRKTAGELEGMTRIPAYRRDMGVDEIGYMPSLTKKKRSAIFDSWVEGVVNHSDGNQRQAAYDVIAWHIRPENLATRLASTGNLPPRKAVIKEPAFEAAMAKEPLQRQALDELNYAKTFPMSPITLDIRVRIQMATKDIVMDGKPAKETLEQARKELDYKWQTDVLPKLK